MKVIIAGSRNISVTTSEISQYLGDVLSSVTEVVSGGATGIDTSGENFAREFKLPITRFLPDWDTHGRAAGPLRNKKMAQYGDVLLLIWDGSSKGSKSMKSEMKKLNKPIVEVIYGNSV